MATFDKETVLGTEHLNQEKPTSVISPFHVWKTAQNLERNSKNRSPAEMQAKTSPAHPSDVTTCKMSNFRKEPNDSLATVTVTGGEDTPFNFLGVFCDGIIAGGAAGVVVEAALYPIDTIKTRLQAAHVGGKIMLKGLYSGLAGNLAGVLPASAIFVGVYEPTKQKLLKSLPENLSALAHLVFRHQSDCRCYWRCCFFYCTSANRGCQAKDANCTICFSPRCCPPYSCQGGFQRSLCGTSHSPYPFLISPSESSFQCETGYGSFLLRDLPFDALQFCIYEQLRIGFKLAARRDLNDPEVAMIGAFAGAITGAITTPLDVIKTRLMVQGSENQYRGICDCVRTIMREEGSPAFWKGIGPRVLWIGVGGSIFFGILERTKQILEQRQLRDQESTASKHF